MTLHQEEIKTMIENYRNIADWKVGKFQTTLVLRGKSEITLVASKNGLSVRNSDGTFIEEKIVKLINNIVAIYNEVML